MKKYISWLQIEEFIEDICRKYKNANLSGVYGLPRGGLVFAVMLSHRLNIPMLAAPTDGCLIIDDICDSGESLIHYQNNTSEGVNHKYHIVTMYYKDNKLGVKPESWGYKKKNDWIVFPWEEKMPERGLLG